MCLSISCINLDAIQINQTDENSTYEPGGDRGPVPCTTSLQLSDDTLMLRSLLKPHPATAFLRQSRWFRGGGDGSPPRLVRRDGKGGRSNSPFSPAPAVGKSEWWAVDGEMHEIGEGIPRRERFVIPRDNLPTKKRKQMREQFMRRTRLMLKDSVLVLFLVL
jgi:hypothetical protein